MLIPPRTLVQRRNAQRYRSFSVLVVRHECFDVIVVWMVFKKDSFCSVRRCEKCWYCWGDCWCCSSHRLRSSEKMTARPESWFQFLWFEVWHSTDFKRLKHPPLILPWNHAEVAEVATLKFSFQLPMATADSTDHSGEPRHCSDHQIWILKKLMKYHIVSTCIYSKLLQALCIPLPVGSSTSFLSFLVNWVHFRSGRTLGI